jgi:hypothetical protein
MGIGTSNQLFKPCGSIDENLAKCLQRHVVLGYERNRKYLYLNINNMVLQTVPWEDNCDFHQKTGEIWGLSGKCPGGLDASKFCRRNNLSFEQLND